MNPGKPWYLFGNISARWSPEEEEIFRRVCGELPPIDMSLAKQVKLDAADCLCVREQLWAAREKLT